MITITLAEVQSRFGELVDRSQREPIAVTRRGRTVAYVVSGHDMQALADVTQRRQEAARWYAQYRSEVLPAAITQAAATLMDEDVAGMVKALR